MGPSAADGLNPYDAEGTWKAGRPGILQGRRCRRDQRRVSTNVLVLGLLKLTRTLSSGSLLGAALLQPVYRGYHGSSGIKAGDGRYTGHGSDWGTSLATRVEVE